MARGTSPRHEGAWVPAGSGALEYVSPGPRTAADDDPLRRELAEEVARAAATLGRPALARDVRLDRVADDVARTVRGGELTSINRIAFLLSHYGIVEPEPSLALSATAPGREGALARHLRPQIPQMLQQGRWGRLGIGIARTSWEVRVVLALQEQHLRLAPVPRQLPARGAVGLSGQLLDGFREAQVLVTVPRGGVREFPVRQSRGGFEAEVACSEGAGVYQVEIGAQNDQGPVVLANFPLFCGVDPPRRVAVSVTRPEGAQDPEAAEEGLFALCNRARAAAGLAPLSWDARLATVARAYSREMADTGLVGHVSPRTGSPVDRVQKAHLAPQILMENVAREYSAAQAHEGLMASPGHRANVLDPRVTHVGVGVTAGHPEAGSIPLFFTQLFAAW